MAIRKQWEALVAERLAEAERYIRRRQEERAFRDEELEREARDVITAALLFAFGELSSDYRTWCNLADCDLSALDESEIGLYVNRLLACLARARRRLASQGLLNPLLRVEADGGLPDWVRHRAWEQRRQQERAWWKLFWLSFWPDRLPL